MTGAECAARLVEHGLDPGELAAKQSLFERVLGPSGLAGLSPSATESPAHLWWVPGRLEVFGKHTDYAGGRTLVCAVPRGFAVAARPRADGIVRVVDAKRGDSLMLLPAADGPSFRGWRHYVEVVVRRLARNFPASAIGADVVIASDLPRASGMSSSSALLIGIATALLRVGGIKARDEWTTNIRDSLDTAGYFACIENGLSLGTLEGDAGVGTHGGSEDHAAIVAASSGHLSAFAFVPMRPIGSVRLPDDWSFVLAPCGVTASKTGGAMESYNRLSRGAEMLLELWNRVEPRAASLGSALGPDAHVAGGASAADRLRNLVRASSVDGWSAEPLERRLDHFIREDARVPAALAAFGDGDRARVSAVSEESQADAETLLGNQVSETIALARSARERGAFAASSFGAGFGGSVWALVSRTEAAAFARRWHPNAFVGAPGPSLTEL
jgi:galactokinase